MSTIEDAIRSAREKGYKDYSETSGSYTKKYHSDILLDPLFWQTLGKAKGWNTYKTHTGSGYPMSAGDPPSWKRYKPEWLYNQHRFIDHLAEKKSAEEFFATL